MSRVLVPILAGLAFAAACDGETGGAATTTDSGGGGGAATTAQGGAGGKQPPADSCIQPGDKGNDKGVGTFCTPGGNECLDFAGAPFCLADVGLDPWMCTRIGCDEKTDCGDGAGCLLEDKGSACVPCKCSDQGIGCQGDGGGQAGGGGQGGSAGQAGGAGGK